MSAASDAGTTVLYHATADAGCLAARFLLTALRVDFDVVPVDAFPGLDATSSALLAAHGPLPVLSIGGETSSGAIAVLEHIAERLDAGGRFSRDAAGWLEFASGELAAVGQARTAALFGGGAAVEQVDRARAALLALEDELCLQTLRGQAWFGGRDASMADVALYPQVALMRDIGLELEEFPTLRSWLGRMQALAPSVSMPGIFDTG